MIMERVLYVFLFMLSSTVLHAQQVIATAGATDQTASGGVSYTIGESVTETFAISSVTITQGFQQTKLTVTAIFEVADLGYSLIAFPNPATDFVKLNVSGDNYKGLRYVLYDLKGITIAEKQLESNETVIPFSDLGFAEYILKVFKDQKEIKSFKIVKTN
jgi:hypothetical protein